MKVKQYNYYDNIEYKRIKCLHANKSDRCGYAYIDDRGLICAFRIRSFVWCRGAFVLPCADIEEAENDKTL